MTDNGKREAILEAAFKVIADKGYFETRVEDIARAAGVAKGTVYLHFKDKADIYIGLVDWLFEQAVGAVRDVDTRPLSPREKLEQVLSTWTDYVFARPGAIGLLSFEGAHAHIESQALDRLKRTLMPRMREMIEAISAIVRQGIASGDFRDVDPIMGAMTFAHAFRTSVIAVQQKLPVEQPGRAALDILFNGILARADSEPVPVKPQAHES